MKKLIFMLALAASFAACKKNNPSPEVITKTDTVRVTDTVHAGLITKTDTIIKTDTVDCIPLSDIIEGTWYCYAYQSYNIGVGTSPTITQQSPSQQVIFTATSLSWASGSNQTISFSSNYSSVYNSSNQIYYSATILNCAEIKLENYDAPGPSVGSVFYLRRNQ